jgi:hypothetical protein
MASFLCQPHGIMECWNDGMLILKERFSFLNISNLCQEENFQKTNIPFFLLQHCEGGQDHPLFQHSSIPVFQHSPDVAG